MADDTMNDGSEEEKKSNLSDEDFGLPDLEFDELQELDFNLDDDSTPEEEEANLPEVEGIDMSVLDEIEIPDSMDAAEGLKPGDLDPPESSVLDQGLDEVEDVLDSAQLISDRLGDDESGDDMSSFSSDINYDDLMGGIDDADSLSMESDDSAMLDDIGLDVSTDDTSDSDDLLANIDSPDQLAALGILDEDNDGEAESASDDLGSSLFSSDTERDSEDSIFGSDSMSLDAETTAGFDTEEKKELPNYKPYSYEESSSGGFTKIILIGVILVTIVAGLFYYFSLDQTEKQVVKKEVPKKKVTKKNKKPATVSKTDADKAATKKETSKAAVKKEKPAVAKPAPTSQAADPGQIVRVTEKSSRSYVIIGSFIDEDLAMDYAVKLSGEGKGVKIIHPFGKSKRYRVSISDYASYGDAASELNGYKSQYGDQVWALKY